MQTLLVFLAIAFVALGFYGRDRLMKQNACQMTFTSMAKMEVDVSSSVPGVGTLFRHPAHGTLNKQPVLFLPGQDGKADQVRSLSSPMHNDDAFFQYFAVDFSKNIGSALHGSLLLTQAAFVNDAIRTILELYDSDSDSLSSGRPTKVMLVGHSIGGMLARTSLMLSNHPVTNGEVAAAEDDKDSADKRLTAACAVSDIVLLAAPTKAAPYSPDGSMAAVFRTVNRGWVQSHYTESRQCQASHKAFADKVKAASSRRANRRSTKKTAPADGADADSRVCAFNNNTRTHEKVTLQADCSVCVPQVRLLSVTGGDMDILVPAHLTSTETLTPRARNMTQDLTPTETTLTGRVVGKSEGIISNIMKGMGLKWTLGAVKSLVDVANPLGMMMAVRNGLGGAVYAVQRTVRQVLGEEEPVDVEVAARAEEPVVEVEQEVPEVPQVPRPDYSNYTFGGLMRLEQEHWDEHIYPYVDSQHYSLRSSQMKACGFTVDHLAIVWCRQLIHAVSDAMKVLALNPSDLSDPRITSEAYAQSVASSQGKVPVFTNVEGRVRWDKLVPMRRNNTAGRFYTSVVGESKLMIPPVAAFHLKNSSYHAFNHAAPVDELDYMASKLSGGGLFSRLQAMAVWYVSNHLSTVLAAYVFIAIMVLSVPLRRRASNWRASNKKGSEAGDFGALYASAHLHLEDLALLMISLFAPLLNTVLPPALLQTQAYQAFFAAIAPADDNNKARKGWISMLAVYAVLLLPVALKVGWVDYLGRGLRGSRLLHEQKRIIMAFVAYGSALGLRFLLTSSVYGVRFLLNGVYSLLYSVLYKNLVPKPVRKWVRGWKKALTGVLPGATSFVLILATSLCLVLVSQTWARRAEVGVVGALEYAESVGTIGAVFVSVLFTLKAMVFPSRGAHSSFQYLELATALMYLPMLVLAAPSTFYSYTLLTEHPDMYANVHGAFKVFHAERMNFFVGVLGIALHWVLLSYWSYNYAHTGNMLGIKMLAKILGRPDVAFTGTPGPGKRYNGLKAIGSASCCHEDGGRNATFEEVLPVAALVAQVAAAGSDDTLAAVQVPAASPHQEVSRGVDLGCTYRVIFCECHKDRRLKDEGAWCEFCRCPRCGPVTSMRDTKSARSWWGDGNDDDADIGLTAVEEATAESGITAQYPEYSANQVLLACMLVLGARGAVLYSDVPHEQLMFLSSIAWAYVTRDFLVYFKVMHP